MHDRRGDDGHWTPKESSERMVKGIVCTLRRIMLIVFRLSFLEFVIRLHSFGFWIVVDNMKDICRFTSVGCWELGIGAINALSIDQWINTCVVTVDAFSFLDCSLINISWKYYVLKSHILKLWEKVLGAELVLSRCVCLRKYILREKKVIIKITFQLNWFYHLCNKIGWLLDVQQFFCCWLPFLLLTL